MSIRRGNPIIDFSNAQRLDAELFGGVVAGLMAGPLYGTGATWLKKMLPWIKTTEDADGKDHGPEKQTSNVTDHELANQTGNVAETEMQAPLYAGKHGQSTKVLATTDGVSTIV